MPKRDDGLMTVGTMAARLAHGDVYSPRHIARQLRDFIPRGLLESRGMQGTGRTAAALFDDYSLCQARLLLILSRVPLFLGQLGTATLHMNSLAPADGERLRGTFEHDTSLPAPVALALAVRGVRAGESWWFRLHPHPWASDAPEIGNDVPLGPVPAGTMAIMRGGFTTAPHGPFDPTAPPSPITLDFHLNPLWKPLLDTPAGDDDATEEELDA
jgi:hypothetical protein